MEVIKDTTVNGTNMLKKIDICNTEEDKSYSAIGKKIYFMELFIESVVNSTSNTYCAKASSTEPFAFGVL